MNRSNDRPPAHFDLASASRRDFLMRFCQGTGATLIPAFVPRFNFPKLFSSQATEPAVGGCEFHFQPHYRAGRPLDTVLPKVQAGADHFIAEQYHDKIASILSGWRKGLLRSKSDLGVFKSCIADNFLGSAPKPSQSRVARSAPPVEVRENEFDQKLALKRESFLHQLQVQLAPFSKFLTVEFQVTGIEIPPAVTSVAGKSLQTRVRYELVGTGSGFYREQRVGYWQIEWQEALDQRLMVSTWRITDETRSRAIAPGFADITASVLSGNSSYSQQLLHGVDYWRTVLDGACGIDIYGHNGISIADFDDDGHDDVYICQPAGLPNRLYRNRGDGTFEDVTERSALGLLENSSCALFADFDNDGRQDVIIVTAAGPQLFLNRGEGVFQRKLDAFRFATSPQGTFTGAAVADYDRDGWLDIYFCQYSYYQGAEQYRYPLPYHDAENGPPNFMMRNQRDGTFRDVTAESGLAQNNTRYSFCCGWCDYNGDGWPDLYVVNDFGRKNLYRNDGGTFTDVAATLGVEDVGAGMSVCWFDYDNDGSEDLYVANMWTAAGERISFQEVFKKDSPENIRELYRKHAMGNSIFHNRAGVFHNATESAGVAMGRWAWSSDSLDFDHDGFLDLYIANGMISGGSRNDLNSFFWRQVVANSPDKPQPSREYEQGWNAINELIRADGAWSGFERNVFYANNRDGTFSDISGAVGLDFVEDGRSFAIADFDHDGRQEIFLKNRNAPQLRILKNVIDNLPASISFSLRGTKSNRDAIGAVITVQSAAGRQTRCLQAGSGFLAQHSKELFFGLGEAGASENGGARKTASGSKMTGGLEEVRATISASVHWPSGLVQHWDAVPVNHRIFLEEGSEHFRAEPFHKAETKNVDSDDSRQSPEQLPANVETWLIEPIDAPDLQLSDLSGKMQTFTPMRGRPALLSFVSKETPACLENLERLERAYSRWAAQGFYSVAINVDQAKDEELRILAHKNGWSFPILHATDNALAVYNILYRYVFDRHRDFSFPISFLLEENARITKVYQGKLNLVGIEDDFRHTQANAIERLQRSLPFRGNAETYEFGRNYLSLGSIFFQRGCFEEAATAFRSALRDDPASAEAAYGLGSSYLSLARIAEARDSLERATTLHANSADTMANAWNNLGLIATRESNTAKAIQCFQRALLENPDHLVALNNLGNAYRLQKDWNAARQTFERALQMDAADADANYGLAMVFAAEDDGSHTYEYLQRALKSRANFPEALNNLGVLYLRTQRRDEAVASFEQCIRIAPDFDQAYLNLARVYAIEASPEKARQLLLELLRRHPENGQAKTMLSQLR